MASEGKSERIGVEQGPKASVDQRPIAGPALLIAGDVVSFLVFAAIGRRNHSENGAVVDVALTAAPFLAAWLLVAALAGALRGDLLLSPKQMLKRTALAWLLAWPLGLGLRALVLQREIPLSFAIVVGIANTVLLLGWRGAAAWIAGHFSARNG